MGEYVESNAAQMEERSLVDILREKTEETDMNAFLKTAFGGYTKQSVLDYISAMKKNQQTMADTFYKNQQALFDEKEKLKKSNESLTNKLNKVETEYQNLSQAMEGAALEGKEFTHKDLMALKGKVAALEDELKKEKEEDKGLLRKMGEKDHTIQNLMTQLEQMNQETVSLKEMIRAEKLETKKSRDRASQLSSELEGEKEAVRYWKGLQSEGKQAELMAKVNELSEHLSLQTELLEKENSDRASSEEIIASLKEEVNALKANLGSLNHILENTNLQNDRLASVNEGLTAKMAEDHQKIVGLIREKSEASVDKLIAWKKLSEAEAKISMLEMSK